MILVADALVVGSPVYKGGYTGLFKNLIDLIDPLALVGKPVLLVARGGGNRHAQVGALDAMTKLTMQDELARIWREEKVTMVLVTHDLEEAIFLADRVQVLPKKGRRRPG